MSIPPRQFELVYDAGSNDPIVLAYSKGQFDNSYMLDVLLRLTRPGGRVLDLGSHVGTLTLGAAAAGYEVIAVDATPKHVALVRESCRRNGFDRVHVVHAVVSDQRGMARFHSNGLFGMVAYPGLQGSLEEVETVRAADLVRRHGWDRLDFVKIDIEGSEIRALQGLREYLDRPDGPIIWYECNSWTLMQYGVTTRDLRRLLAGMGYRSYRMSGGWFGPLGADEFHPESWLDLLALKPRHEPLIASCLFEVFSREQVIQGILAEGTSSESPRRQCTGTRLSEVDPSILEDPRIVQLLGALLVDHDDTVRTSTAWWKERVSSSA